MSTVLLLTLITAVILGLFRILQKVMGINFHPLWAATLMYGTLFILSLIPLLIMRPHIAFENFLRKGLWFFLLAGIILVAYDIISFFIFFQRRKYKHLHADSKRRFDYISLNTRHIFIQGSSKSMAGDWNHACYRGNYFFGKIIFPSQI